MYIIHICKKLQSQRSEEGSTPVKRGKKRPKRGAEASRARRTPTAPREKSWRNRTEYGLRFRRLRREGGEPEHALKGVAAGTLTLRSRSKTPKGRGGRGQEPLPREVPFRLQPPSELRRVFIRELLGHSQRRSVAAPSPPPHRASRGPPCHRQTRSRGRQRGKENNLAAPNPD